VGGYIGASVDKLPETRRKVSGETFMKIFEGDVVINPGVGACLESPLGIAEVATHEIGHAIGFGHSSEDSNEADPTKEDATMYYRVHNDGRGAAVHADDVAALLYVYPADLLATTPIEQAACEIGLGLMNAACFDTSRLAEVPFKRMRKAAKVADRAAASSKPAKQRRLLDKALKALAKAEGSIERFVSGPCATACAPTSHGRAIA
jgi:predicted Zn-dependent protease